MKSIKLLLAGAFASVAVATSAHAGYYHLTHLGGLDEFVHLSAGEYYNNTFNLNDYGFNDAYEDIVWAKLSFAFADDTLSDEDLDLGHYLDWLVDGKEKVTVYGDGYSVDIGDVDGLIWAYDWITFEGHAGSLLVNTLQDGILNYSVKVTKGDVFLKEVKLKAKSEYAPRVPDSGSTLALLGLSLLGLGAVSRRKQK